jgi:hypothetical protein
MRWRSLIIAAALALLACGEARRPVTEFAPPPALPAEPVTGTAIDVRRLDIEVDLRRSLPGEELPSGASWMTEQVGPPAVAGGVARDYLVLTPGPGESMDRALARFQTWCARLRLPEGREVAFQRVRDQGNSADIGWRTHVVLARPVIDARAIARAPTVHSYCCYRGVSLTPPGDEAVSLSIAPAWRPRIVELQQQWPSRAPVALFLRGELVSVETGVITAPVDGAQLTFDIPRDVLRRYRLPE